MWSPLRLLAISFLSLKGKPEYNAKGNGYGYGAIEVFSSCRPPFALNANRKESRDPDTALSIQPEERKQEAMKPSRKKYLQEKLGMDKNEIERLIRGNPSILTCNSEENMGPTIDWLQNRLKLDQKGLKKIVLAHNRLLGSSIAKLDSNISWLQKRFNISDDQIGKLVCKNPILLQVSIQNILKPNIQYLKSKLEFDDKAIQKLVFKVPYICSTNFCEKVSWLQERLDLNNTESTARLLNRVHTALSLSIETLEARICWFETESHLPSDKVAKLILRSPHMLGLQSSLLANKKKWLQQRLKIGDDEFGKLIFMMPPLLGLDMQATIEPNLCWLQSRLRLNDTGVMKMVCKAPSLLGLDMDANIEPKLSWLQSRLGLDDAGLRKIVCSQPSIMCLSPENNLDPKINFLAEVLGEEGTRLLISKHPTTLARSLEKRIKPRVTEALELGFLLDAKSLGTITCCTEKMWEEKKLRFLLRQGC